MVNAGKYTIHGSYGIYQHVKTNTHSFGTWFWTLGFRTWTYRNFCCTLESYKFPNSTHKKIRKIRSTINKILIFAWTNRTLSCNNQPSPFVNDRPGTAASSMGNALPPATFGRCTQGKTPRLSRSGTGQSSSNPCNFHRDFLGILGKRRHDEVVKPADVQQITRVGCC